MENNTMPENKMNGAEVLASSLNAFSENENHKQKLFVQFFLGIIVVIVGYSYVYSEINSEAKIWDLTRKGETYIVTSYSISSLIIAYVISQGVLVLLARLIVSGGYSFRKYQMIAYRIRKNSLGKSFNKYYGSEKDEFSPYNKFGCLSSNSYLPEFDTIFLVFIWCLQILVFLSFILKLGTFDNVVFKRIIDTRELVYIPSLKLMVYAIRFWIIPFAFCFFLVTAHFQSHYYVKYLRKVREAPGRRNRKLYDKMEYFIKYKRSNSRCWGFLCLLLLAQITLSILLIFNYASKIKYLETFDLCFIVSISILLWTCLLVNLNKADNFLMTYIGNPPARKSFFKRTKIVLTKHFLNRSESAKRHRMITPVFLWSLLLLTIISNIYLAVGNYLYRYSIMTVYILSYILIAVYVLRKHFFEEATSG